MVYMEPEENKYACALVEYQIFVWFSFESRLFLLAYSSNFTTEHWNNIKYFTDFTDSLRIMLFHSRLFFLKSNATSVNIEQ